MLATIYFAAAALILCRGLFIAINRMGRGTPLALRLGWLLLTTGALDIVLGPFFGRIAAPGYGDALLLTALAWFVVRHGASLERPPAP
jgi:hypothetical protein